jgi:hypothetical protein
MKHSVALTIASLPLDPLSDISSGGRHHSRNVGAVGTAIGIRHHASRVAAWVGYPVIRMTGKGVGVAGNVAKSSGAFFFFWTLIALVVTALFSVVLSARGFWRMIGPGR